MTKINHVTVHCDDGEQRQRAHCAAFVSFFLPVIGSVLSSCSASGPQKCR